jgi:hypothetical protein
VRQFLRVALVKTSRTDLPCIACGRFRTEFAIVAPGKGDESAHVGVHRRSQVQIHAPRVYGARDPSKPYRATETETELAGGSS